MSHLSRLLTALLTALALAGCASAGVVSQLTRTPAAVMNFTAADTGRTVSAPIGSEVDITLQTIGPGQYSTPQLSSSSIQLVTTSQVTPVVPAGPTQLFRFAVLSAGTTTISIQSTGQNPTFTLTVQSS